jgi:hypothetical protein
MNDSDFKENDAWLLFRLDTQVKEQPVDVFVLMDLPSGIILGFESILGLTVNPEEAQRLLQARWDQKGIWPRRVLIGKGDPVRDDRRQYRRLPRGEGSLPQAVAAGSPASGAEGLRAERGISANHERGESARRLRPFIPRPIRWWSGFSTPPAARYAR